MVKLPVIFCVFLFTASLLPSCRADKPEAQEAIEIGPNVLIILADDMGYGDTGLSGNPWLSTPRLDALANAGISFLNFYVSSVCAPTRASLLTGRYNQRTGVRSVTNGFEIMDPGETTIAEILQTQGYRTGIFGKWHLGEYYPGLPNAQGFVEYIGFRTGHTANYYDAWLEKNGKPYQTKGYITDALSDEALGFMHEDQSSPFFCYLAYNAPHTPLQVDSLWFERFLEAGLDERTARVYGMVENIDMQVGRILDSLENSDILENTIVIFMSDNGPVSGWRLPQSEMRYNAGLRDQKFTVYEGGIRTRSYWKWDKAWPGSRELGDVAAHIDVLPTLLDALNVPLPESLEIDGKSLHPLLSGGADSLQERMFFQKYSLETLKDPAPFPGGMVRKGPWKMVNGTELYNLQNDPGESQNLADRKPVLLEDLTRSYMDWYEDVMEHLPRAGPFIDIGHPEENPIWLQPHHGTATGGLQFTGMRGLLGDRSGVHPNGVDGDWLANWKQKGDMISWKGSIVQQGRFSIGALIRDKTPSGKVRLQVTAGDQSRKITIEAEELSDNWAVREFGIMALDKVDLDIKVELLEPMMSGNFEIRALVVEKLP